MAIQQKMAVGHDFHIALWIENNSFESCLSWWLSWIAWKSAIDRCQAESLRCIHKPLRSFFRNCILHQAKLLVWITKFSFVFVFEMNRKFEFDFEMRMKANGYLNMKSSNVVHSSSNSDNKFNFNLNLNFVCSLLSHFADKMYMEWSQRMCRISSNFISEKKMPKGILKMTLSLFTGQSIRYFPYFFFSFLPYT